MTPEQRSGVQKGTLAVAEKLREQYLSEFETTAPAEDWLPQARELINAWLLASNAVGEPETIYDDFCRLREEMRLIERLTRDDWRQQQLNGVAQRSLERCS